MSSSTADAAVTKLIFVTNSICDWIDPYIPPFEDMMDGKVTVEIVSYDQDPFGQLFETIESEARTQGTLFAGYITPPSPMGDVAPLDGWADYTAFIQNGRAEEWVDILPAYREYVASFESKILTYPLDGDLLLYYYNRAILEAFNLTVPRTWEEYNEVAAAVHGQTFEGKTLSGSCLGRVKGCAGSYWAHAVLSSMTNTQGPAAGSLFSTNDMSPLTGEAMECTLEIMKESVRYGSPNELDGCWEINIADLNDGSCAQTINWGNQFTEYAKVGSTLVGGRLSIAQTPGSTQILDRDTMKLVDCNADLCPNGGQTSDGKRYNQAPYLAFGGWSCAVNNFIDDTTKDLAMQFCSFVSKGAVPQAFGNATSDLHSGQDPVRLSQLDVDTYVARGYGEVTTQEYLDNIKTGLSSENAVIDLRIPTAPALMATLDSETYSYLTSADGDASSVSAAEVTENINTAWDRIIANYDAQPTTATPVLEVYQQLRGVPVSGGDTSGNNTTAIIVGSVVGGVLLLIILVLVYRIHKLNTTLKEMEKRGEEVPQLRASSVLRPMSIKKLVKKESMKVSESMKVEEE